MKQFVFGAPTKTLNQVRITLILVKHAMKVHSYLTNILNKKELTKKVYLNFFKNKK